MQPDRPYGTARAVLDQLVARLPALDVDVPERRYVSIGLPALDCEQLVVSIDRIVGHEGNPGSESNNPVRCLIMRAVELTVWLVRCVPTLDDDGNAPSAESIDDSSELIAGDPQAILTALLGAYRDGDVGSTWGVVFLDWRALTPQGGLAGGAQRLRYDLSAPLP